jgi:Cu2+-exporting ATPase
VSTAVTDYSSFVSPAGNGRLSLRLAVEGISCAGCAMKIERELNAKKGVEARVNMTRRQLTLLWDGNVARGGSLVGDAEKLGFRFSPISAERDESAEEKFLLRCMAVAGFASGNIMIFSLALWFSSRDSMGGATQDLFHWICALISLPTVVYAGRPFFRSAWDALRHMRTNMDVPISVGVTLATLTSLYETLNHGAYVYFDAAVMLLFLLLAGRYLDRQARGRARAAAQNILALNTGTATVLSDEEPRQLPASDLLPGMTVLVASGERIYADGKVLSGVSSVDASALTGETQPATVKSGDAVLMGMVNLGAPLQMKVLKSPAESLGGEIVSLMQKAEQGNARYVRLADRISRVYTPVVHALALGAFVLWYGVLGVAWQKALMVSVTVLVITCPCALGLAVPVVQVLASQWLFRRGLLVKAADAFERMAATDTIVFDKTGVLTLADNEADISGLTEEQLCLAASLAMQSRHPLSRAVTRAWTGRLHDLSSISEVEGAGVSARFGGREVRLGSRAFCGVLHGPEDAAAETWISDGMTAPARIPFHYSLRPDAEKTINTLRNAGYTIMIVSGDRETAVEAVAGQLGISEYYAAVNPKRKLEIIEELQAKGLRVMMVGDGLNDSAALLRADCSMSPSSALEITQNAADVVFQGASLKSVALALQAARFCQRLVAQNFVMALAYNLVALPLAFAGLVTPLIAAAAMSCSSLAVTFNALRFNRMEEE